jgi:short-subunit dehydrogenase
MAKRSSLPEFNPPVVWVVGASRGIGGELARAFASTGARTCLTSRSRGRLSALAREIAALGGNVTVYPADITDLRKVRACARRIRRDHGDVDVLINNAGITVFKTLLDTSFTELDAIIDTNLRGQIACIKAVLPSMVRRRSGWICNILSNAAVKTFEGSAAYTAAKQGMLGLGRVLREEVRSYGVKVVNVIPGATLTGMWSPAMRKKYGKRMMRARDVAETVLALYRLPPDVVPDELVVRPMKGDLA